MSTDDSKTWLITNCNSERTTFNPSKLSAPVTNLKKHKQWTLPVAVVGRYRLDWIDEQHTTLDV